MVQSKEFHREGRNQYSYTAGNNIILCFDHSFPLSSLFSKMVLMFLQQEKTVSPCVQIYKPVYN